MAKMKLLSATALTAATLLFVSCKAATTTSQDTQPVQVDPSSVETLVTDSAENKLKSEALAASQKAPDNSTPTVQQAKEFLEGAEIELAEYNAYASKVYWIKANFITEDTAALESRVGEEGAKLSTRMANEAKRFKGLSLPADMQRSERRERSR